MHYKGSGPAVDPAAVQKKLDELLLPGLGAPGSEPGGLPGLPGLNFDEPPKIQ